MDASVLDRPELAGPNPTGLSLYLGGPVARVLAWDRRRQEVAVVSAVDGADRVVVTAEYMLQLDGGAEADLGSLTADRRERLAALAGVVIDPDGRLVRSDPAAAAELARRPATSAADGPYPGPMTYDPDSRELAHNGAAVAVVYEADDFPCLDRAEADYAAIERQLTATGEKLARAYSCHDELVAACAAVDDLDLCEGYTLADSELPKLWNALTKCRAALKYAGGR